MVPTTAAPPVVIAKEGGLVVLKEKIKTIAPITIENSDDIIKYLHQMNKPKNPAFEENTLSAQFDKL